MTEYTTDPDAIQEFLHARDRTANWVNIHGGGMSFASPSSPPSTLSDEDAPSYGPSDDDASSSHSIPPRMLLRYDDGRPDVPISQDRSKAHSRSRGQPRSRSGSLAPPPDPHSARYAQSLSYASGSRYAAATAAAGQHLVTPPRSPENIRVLPSRQAAEDSRGVPGPASSSSHHSRAPPAQTIFAAAQPSIHDRLPPHADPLHAPNRNVHAPTPRHPGSSTQPIPVIASPPAVSQSRSQPNGSRFYEQPGMASSMIHNGLPYNYTPPAIVYAPSGRHGRSNYQPPAIVYSPSSHAHRRAPGIAYSRSDPLPQPAHSHVDAGRNSSFPPSQAESSHRHHRSQSSAAGSHPRSRGMSHSSSMHRDRARTRTPTPPLSESDTSSDTSGSTYYVLPSPGQKVQIIVPNSAHVSMHTPSPNKSSSSRSPRSPSSSAEGSPKKPFFARIFSRGSGSVDSRGSSSAGGHARAERGRIPVPWR